MQKFYRKNQPLIRQNGLGSLECKTEAQYNFTRCSELCMEIKEEPEYEMV